MTKFNALVGDISKCTHEAIVNSANEFLARGSGVCGAIHKAAGFDLQKECTTRYGKCEIGKAVITSAYNLPCKYVIHAVGPKYFNLRSQGIADSRERERQQYECYHYVLNLAKTHGIKGIAFPCMGIGAHKFPEEVGVEIAVKSLSDFIAGDTFFDMVTMYYSSEKLLDIHNKCIGEISAHKTYPSRLPL